MVLAELGSKITNALRTFQESTVVDRAVLDKLLNSISIALFQADVEIKLVKQLSDNIVKKAKVEEMAAGINKRRVIQSIVIQELYALLDSGNKPFVLKKGKPNVIMFVGLQGSGKTTTCTKYAYHYARRGWKTALVCADTYRAGAFDQLRQNATKANIPYYGSYTVRDPAVVAKEGVDKFKEMRYEVIIVDTSGRHKQEAALFEEMKEVARAVQPDEVIFVMDGMIGQAARLQAQAFKEAVDIGSVIITKLDGAGKGGGALSAVAATKSPITFIGTGEHMDEFEPFDTKSFVSRLLGMGDINGLMRMMAESSKLLEKPELFKKITEGTGEFTFRDMKEQFENLLQMGPLSKLMGMIPGLSAMVGQGKDEESAARIRRFMVIMDSMTPHELDSDTRIFNTQPSRMERVARGSGSSLRQVQEVMDTFKPFKKVADKIKSLSKGGGLDFGKMKGAKAQNSMRQIASALNPQMLQKMGGMGNLQNLMKQFAGGKFPPGMAGLGGMGGLGGLMDG